ncbi:MAG: hypothetical protein AABX01_03405 [Candidatus Micrarchaeota archaeon]
MRGIFFSIDAILALLIAFSLSAFILNAIAGLPDPSLSSSQPEKLADDALISMDKSGVLKNALESKSAIPLKEFARVFPSNICYRVEISGENEGVIIADENCACKTYSISRRNFIISGSTTSIYLAEMRVCYKK